MKILAITSTVLALMTAGSQAASVYWSFTAAGGGSYAGPASSGSLVWNTPTLNNEFQETPVLTAIQGTGSATVSGFSSNSPPAFTHPETEDEYDTGYGLNWGSGSGSSNHLTGSGFAVTLNTTGFTDLSLQFDVRCGVSGTNGSTGAPSAVQSVRYSLNGTDWVTLPAADLPTWGTGGTWETGELIDLGGFAELADQEELHLEVIFNGGTKAGTGNVQNMRITNLYLSANAIPEPSGGVLAMAGAMLLALRRRR